MYNSFLDGTKSAVEMCSVANMTGLVPDVPAMHFPPAAIDDLPALLVSADYGGILSRKGVVEVVSASVATAPRSPTRFGGASSWSSPATARTCAAV